MNLSQERLIQAIFKKHLQKAVNEITDLENSGCDFYWGENTVPRLASQATEVVVMLQESVRQVRNYDEKNHVAESAMDYLRRSDLLPAITRGVIENTIPQDHERRTT